MGGGRSFSEVVRRHLTIVSPLGLHILSATLFAHAAQGVAFSRAIAPPLAA